MEGCTLMLNQAQLKEKLSYDQDTGEFTWKIIQRGTRKGSTAGSVNDQGYIIIRLNNVAYRAHRLAWLYVNGEFPTHEIDHVNGDRADNRLVNLRDVPRKENKKNVGKYITNLSGVNGVRWYAPLKKWHVQIQHNNLKIHVGYFTCLDTAISERKRVEQELGFHNNHGERQSHEANKLLIGVE